MTNVSKAKGTAQRGNLSGTGNTMITISVPGDGDMSAFHGRLHSRRVTYAANNAGGNGLAKDLQLVLPSNELSTPRRAFALQA